MSRRSPGGASKSRSGRGSRAAKPKPARATARHTPRPRKPKGPGLAQRIAGVVKAIGGSGAMRKAAPGIGVFAIVLLLGLGAAWGVRALEATIIARAKPPAFLVDWPVEQGEQSTWVTPEFQQRILTVASDAWGEDASPFDRAPLARVGDALASSGWFTDRPVISRVSADSVTIDGELRRPVAIVRHDDGRSYLVTIQQFIVDDDILDRQINLDRLPVITGVPEAVPRRDNGDLNYLKPWGSPSLEDGLRLAMRLYANPQEPALGDIDAIDVSQAARGIGLVVILRRREGSTLPPTRVLWGQPPGRFDPADPRRDPDTRDEAMLARLRDALRGPDRADLLEGDRTYNPATGELRLGPATRQPVRTPGR